ncbi:hypothetical protein U9M48_039299 [Paspalum notatum var. saurae]|uniref:Uncharacterized protein n=1 Tax=Paspalum notatum var. saurae TaxID=547442 RepID=A0AAQ3XCJ6_PASNO
MRRGGVDVHHCAASGDDVVTMEKGTMADRGRHCQEGRPGAGEEAVDAVSVPVKRSTTAGEEARCRPGKYGLTFHPNRQDNAVYRAYFSCHKQPKGSGYYRYYVFKFLKINGRYRTNPEDAPIPLKDRSLSELDLMNSVGDLCRFTMHENARQDSQT